MTSPHLAEDVTVAGANLGRAWTASFGGIAGVHASGRPSPPMLPTTRLSDLSKPVRDDLEPHRGTIRQYQVWKA